MKSEYRRVIEGVLGASEAPTKDVVMKRPQKDEKKETVGAQN